MSQHMKWIQFQKLIQWIWIQDVDHSSGVNGFQDKNTNQFKDSKDSRLEMNSRHKSDSVPGHEALDELGSIPGDDSMHLVGFNSQDRIQFQSRNEFSSLIGLCSKTEFYRTPNHVQAKNGFKTWIGID